MGRVGRTSAFRFGFVEILVGVTCLVIGLSGCSTASWVLHHNGTADELIVTADDVDVMIDELSKAKPKNPGSICYNETTDRYELTPDVYKKAIRDGIVRRIQDNKIREFLDGYRPETFVDALRKDMGSAGITILILGVLGVLFY